VGVSRSGKTSTCLYLALHYGVYAANYPLTEDDLEDGKLPPSLAKHKDKLFGLTIDPVRLQSIRNERRPDSRYSSTRQVHYEIKEAETLFRRYSIPFFNSTHSSVEEIATTVLHSQGLQRRFDGAGMMAHLPGPAPALMDSADERVSVFLSDEELRDWPQADFDSLVRSSRRVVVTRGQEGADVHGSEGVIHVPARPATHADATGAGDVFATAFILAVRAGEQVAGQHGGGTVDVLAGVDRRPGGDALAPPLLAVATEHADEEHVTFALRAEGGAERCDQRHGDAPQLYPGELHGSLRTTYHPARSKPSIRPPSRWSTW
jgi:hypothetical protein